MGFAGLDISARNQSCSELTRMSSVPGLEEPATAVIPASSQAAAGDSAGQVPFTRCPQEQDCPGGGIAFRIFECQEGCGFRGCAAGMEIHEAEPHASDTGTMLEMVREVGGSW